ncbi:uncharacterized protein LOC124167646 [Ischnura elegans]|uniref:uncharacterized protein LOC124167646 n=1 Tax=Ischnura elegans TaxID=197161 RepID=UPI001ED8A318|nr:uncharacterized protein LOC124167646 [Ischnura elegans]
MVGFGAFGWDEDRNAGEIAIVSAETTAADVLVKFYKPNVEPMFYLGRQAEHRNIPAAAIFLSDAAAQSTASPHKKSLIPSTAHRGGGVKITSLRVPTVVRNGSESGATLDCEFWVSRDSEAGLVVKWFLNNGPAPVYQWIPGNGKSDGGKSGASGGNGGGPQGLGPLKGKLDLGIVHYHSGPSHRDGTAAASSSGEFGHYNSHHSGEVRHLSALRIRTPTTDLSGDYKCSVSTFHDEDFMVKKMLVFAPEKSMELWQSRAQVATGDGEGDATVTSFLNVTCHARGIYPEPKMALVREPPTLFEPSDDYDDDGSALGDMDGRSSESRPREARQRNAIVDLEAVGGKTSVETTWRPEAGVYDIRASETLPERTLRSPTVYRCELTIPDAHYTVKKQIIYDPGSLDSSGGSRLHLHTHSSCTHLFSVMLLGFCIRLLLMRSEPWE